MNWVCGGGNEPSGMFLPTKLLLTTQGKNLYFGDIYFGELACYVFSVFCVFYHVPYMFMNFCNYSCTLM
jgi:hypothetical protein